jgi:hypothetical protein
MKRLINRLRKQPNRVKVKVLHTATAIFAVVLVFFWVYSLNLSFREENVEAKIREDLSPFSAIKDNIISGYKSLSE